MRIPRLYCPADYQAGHLLTLDKPQAHYILTVLRLKDQRTIELFNGEGWQAQGTIQITSRRTADVMIENVEKIDTESPLQTILVQGISKGDRMDFTVQKCVELGVNQIQPVFTDHCDVKLSDDKLEKKVQQWQDIAINACEQSNRNVLPVILPPEDLRTWFDKNPKLNGLVLNPYAENSFKSLSSDLRENPIYLLIGPEGGLSKDEITRSINHGLTDTRLGQRILRTETAGIAVLSALQTLWGDF